MSLSTQCGRRITRVARLLVAFLIIGAMVFPLSSHSDVAGGYARRLVDSAVGLLRTSTKSSGATNLNLKPQVAGSPIERARHITHFRLCPRRLSLYAGENHTLVPVALDQTGEIVHGVAYEWRISNSAVATISGGTVEAVAPGVALVTVSIGTARATVSVVVLPGARRRLSDSEWDLEHANDCTNPEAVAVMESDQNVAEFSPAELAQHQPVSATQEIEGPSDVQHLFKHAVMRHAGSKGRLPLKAARASFTRRAENAEPVAPQGGVGLIDGDGGDPGASQATISFSNAIGSPRFSPQEMPMGNPTKTKNNLGSYNYSFAAPIVSLPGRGISVNLAMVYNSRVWSKDNNTMTFNYNKGWPAAGWTLGYGRLIQDYDGFGNWMLLGPDGTRTHLQTAYGGSIDGSAITFNPENGKVRYPDGTLVDFDVINGRWLPTKIRNANGQKIEVLYKTRVADPANPDYFPFRWAIDSIQDTGGRYISFNYDPTTKYLTSITAPTQGGGTRTLVELAYQTITLQYSFTAGVTVNGPTSGTQLDVVRRIYYPQTGRGYLLNDPNWPTTDRYASYGMARKVSMRIGMTASSNGTEVAYTHYNYVDVSTQVGLLNDSPQYTTRSEWWQDKTDSNGNPTTAATVYTYSRSAGTDENNFAAEIDTVQSNDGNLKVVTTTGNDSVNAQDNFGHVISTEHKDLANALLRKTTYGYEPGPDGGTQVGAVTLVVDGGAESKTVYTYGNYGRVATMDEYGFSASVQRRTSYSYKDGTAYSDINLVRLVNKVRIYNGADLTTPVAKTEVTYDDYAPTGGMISPTPLPPNHETDFDASNTIRGNVTATISWVHAVNGPSITRYTQYDIFGNVRRAEVSCCNSKYFSFSDATTHYSQPDSVTDGDPLQTPHLTTTFSYDLDTGLVLSTTDPQNRTTSFSYDNAWRLTTVTPPQSAFTTTTQFDKDANDHDLLAYSQKVSYTDTDEIAKTITSKSWFDGAGRVIRAGTGQGSTPSSFDAVKTLYDPVGRVLKRSNPYQGDGSGSGSPTYWTKNVYDPLSRVTEVDLPDDQPAGQRSRIQTTYASAVTTVTDQVGRKRQSEVDGLGRLIKVTEMNPTTGLLDAINYLTTNSYDTLDNLTGVNQGGQTRSFSYDHLSRRTSQNTPEGGAVSFVYTDFGAVLKRTDARDVEAHYKYDTLNRSTQVWYTGLGGSDDPNGTRPPLPNGVAATADVIIAYNNLTSAGAGNGQANRVDDGGGFETYGYDSLSRTTTKTRTIDGNSYQTQYQYNAINQLSLMVYPSDKRVRMNHDLRGRFSGEDKVDAGGTLLTSYVSGISYNVAGQISGMTSGSGVVENYTYSSDRLQLTRQTAAKSGNTLLDLNYSYAATADASGVGTSAGNSGQLMAIGNNPSSLPSAINGQTRTQNFTYDDLGRLMTATGWSTWQRRFDYDRWGNRTGVWDATSGGNQIQSVVREMSGGAPTNRLTTITNNGVPSTQTYDMSGNLTNDGAHTYQYDGEGRIASVDTTGATYFYDSANRRVKKVVGSGGSAVTTYYVWEGAQVIAEYSNAPAGSGGIRYYLADRLSTRMTTDDNGAFLGTQDHLPFGEEGGTSGATEKHRFTNYERDVETVSDYATNRQHQYASARFMQPDFVAGKIGTPQSLNRYSYSMNDPVNLTDSLGLAPQLWDSWMTDASVNGPGLYIDGTQVLEGQESMFWGLLSSGAGVIAAFGSKAYLGARGATYIEKVIYNYVYGRSGNDLYIGVNLTAQYEVADFDGLLNVGYDPWQQTLRSIRRLMDNLDSHRIDSVLTKGPNGEPGLKVQASFGNIVKALKQHYCYGLSAFAVNPIDHRGGMEFRDCYSSPGFHFKVDYPKTEATGFSYKTGLPTKFGRNDAVTWITDFHGDRYNPNHSVWHLLLHFRDFLFR